MHTTHHVNKSHQCEPHKNLNNFSCLLSFPHVLLTSHSVAYAISLPWPLYLTCVQSSRYAKFVFWDLNPLYFYKGYLTFCPQIRSPGYWQIDGVKLSSCSLNFKVNLSLLQTLRKDMLCLPDRFQSFLLFIFADNIF